MVQLIHILFNNKTTIKEKKIKTTIEFNIILLFLLIFYKLRHNRNEQCLFSFKKISYKKISLLGLQ